MHNNHDNSQCSKDIIGLNGLTTFQIEIALWVGETSCAGIGGVAAACVAVQVACGDELD